MVSTQLQMQEFKMLRRTSTSILGVSLLAVEAFGYVSLGKLQWEFYSPEPSSPSFQHHDRRDGECGFIGNPDIYGLGIRLGIYLQWIASCISSTYYIRPLDHPGLLDSYLTFNSALLIAIFVLTAQPLTTHAAEIYIVFFMIFNGWSTAFPIHRRDRKISIRDEFWEVGARSALTFTLNFIWAIYASWFWIAGVNAVFQGTPCGTKVFMFAKVDMSPGTGGLLAARIIFGAASLLMTMAMSIAVLGGLLTRPRIFFSRITESVIWTLFLPTRMGKQRDTQSHPPSPPLNAPKTGPLGQLRAQLKSVQESREQIESQTANPRLQRVWQMATGRGPNGYLFWRVPRLPIDL